VVERTVFPKTGGDEGRVYLPCRLAAILEEVGEEGRGEREQGGSEQDLAEWHS